jgi:predicted ATP-dependent serine protease
VADAPWRCSQCGTVNEPVANACRTCGRWPSLFELEGSTLETDVAMEEEEDEFAAQTVEVEQLEPEVFEVEPDEAPEMPQEFEVDDEELEPERPLWRRLGSIVVPLGIVLYILISALADRG